MVLALACLVIFLLMVAGYLVGYEEGKKEGFIKGRYFYD